jgi:predicted DsbA family dithiol-disulfide isomerase
MPNIQIDIVSDIACPWCAIGYARLERAMKTLGAEYEFTVQWHAFELDPEHSGKGEPILPALVRKYGGSEEEMRANQARMKAVAKDLGLNFEKLQERLTCNTFDAHRLVKWAKEQGKQTAMKQTLFEAYFGQAMDVADQNTLLSCVDAVGLDQAKAKEILESDLYVDEVREDEATYQQMGITSVPAYIINNKYLIPGAQESDAFVQALEEIGSEST